MDPATDPATDIGVPATDGVMPSGPPMRGVPKTLLGVARRLSRGCILPQPVPSYNSGNSTKRKIYTHIHTNIHIYIYIYIYIHAYIHIT